MSGPSDVPTIYIPPGGVSNFPMSPSDFIKAGRGKGLGKGFDMFGNPLHKRHRRMRVTNVRALHRAFRRVKGFAKLAGKVISFTHRVHMKRHAPRGGRYKRRAR